MGILLNQQGQPISPAEILDQPPPANLEAERAVLGSILLDLSKREVVGGILRAEDFHDHRNVVLFEHLMNYPSAEGAVDTILLIDWLKTDLEKIGGAAYLAEVAQSVPWAHNAEHYARLVRKAAAKRELIHDGVEIVRHAYNDADEKLLRDRIARLAERTVATLEPPAFTKLYSSKDFLGLDLKPKFLVQNVLVQGQPMVVAGRSKTMKTSVAIDLAVSLGSGTPFLHQFESQRVRVGVWSGESGAATIRETALRIAEAKNVFLDECDVFWSFELPRLSQSDHLDALLRTIEKKKIDVAIVDPLYLSLLTAESANQASNVFYMGSLLAPLSKAIQAVGCTLIVAHHFRKTPGADDEPASLVELAQSGVAEWVRQWILLARRSPYNGDGRHELWMRTGGSAGHGGLHCLDILEGNLDCGTFGGRTWEVAVRPAREVIIEQQEQKRRAKLEAAKEEEHEKRERIIGAFTDNDAGNTARELRRGARMGYDTFDRLIREMIDQEIVEPAQIIKNGKTLDGYRLVKEEKQFTGLPL